MADSSNSSTSATTSAQSTATTNNSTGNFSGGTGGLSLGVTGPSLSLGKDAGPGYARGDFSLAANLGWTPSLSLDGSGKGNATNMFTGATYNGSTGETTVGGGRGTSSNSNNSTSSSSSTTLTVDSVFNTDTTGSGVKGTSTSTWGNGDYAASKNETSNVDTSTFGKQSDIVTNPTLVVQDKGLVDNGAIDSIEGLVTNQKDKASQDVLEASKKRNEEEAKDKSDKTKSQLRASLEDTEDVEGVDTFKIGDEVGADEKAALDKASEAYGKMQDSLLAAKENLDNTPAPTLTDGVEKGATKFYVDDDGKHALQTYAYNGTDENVRAEVEAYNDAVMNFANAAAATRQAKKAYLSAQADYDGLFTSDDNSRSMTETNLDTFSKYINRLEKAGADEETIQAAREFADAWSKYNENLKNALESVNALKETDFNQEFTKAVVDAIDFEVTLPDGSKQKFSEYATEKATESPDIAAAMYKAKAEKYRAENHPILAKIEDMKAAMVQTWLGSKFTAADNQVRDQFTQMSKTNMRAVYATYNNVLNDPDATPEAKAEAKAAIEQANALMTASTALQASTGFFSGIGDSMSDGTYGTTDPQALNAYQKTLYAVNNFAKITLGLGATPGANQAYQNMFYMNGAKVSETGLFGRDWDGDGFALCQEYGNSAAAGMIAGAGELATGVALMFNPATSAIGFNLMFDSTQTFLNGLYGVQRDARKSQQYTEEVLSYFNEAKDLTAGLGQDAQDAITNAITQIENFELKADEVNNLDNWLEGSGSNTATNEKFNQSLSYDEWLKLIESDETMRNYAKKLTEDDKKNNADTGVNTRE